MNKLMVLAPARTAAAVNQGLAPAPSGSGGVTGDPLVFGFLR
jgi:hypothetical protein